MLVLLGEAALRSIVLAAVTWCFLRLLHIRQPRLLLATWTAVLLVSVAMPWLPQFIPVHLALDPAIPGPLMEKMADLVQQLPDGGLTSDAPVQVPVWPWMETVYAVICGGMLSRIVLGIVLSARLLARAVPVRPAWAAGQRLRISQDVAGPVTIAHVIVLPADALAWPAETREAVLAHEQAHVARWDFAMLVLSQLHRAVFWFSPLPWWLHRRLVTLSELASDDQAMASTGDRFGYAEVLLEMGRRSVPASRGPAMARPSTLLHRIDRILLEQEKPRPPSRVQHAVLTTGMVGLSLGITGLAYDRAPEPATASSVAQWHAPDGFSAPVDPPAIKSGAAPRQVAGVGALILPSAADGRVEPPVPPLPRSALPSPPQTSSARVAGVQSPRPATPAPRPLPRTAARTLPIASVPRAPDQPHLLAAAATGTSEYAGLQARDIKGVVTLASSGSSMAARPNAPAASEAVPPLPHQTGYGSSSLQSGLEGIAGSTCAGVVAVGMRAAGGMPGRPDVVPGQAVPAHAQFFRKENGTLWVRFNAFGRPPLDLPVRFARNGMTWTGEYGIAYTVQAVGGDRLAGLASLVANDSAGLSFGCNRSVSRPL